MWSPGQDLGEALVTSGWAADYRRFSGGHHADAQAGQGREGEGWRWGSDFEQPAAVRRGGSARAIVEQAKGLSHDAGRTLV
jgi:hypothetical protein